MKIISHRGNLKGPNTCIENHPNSIENALRNDFWVEVDIWGIDGKFYLGHDKPEYEIAREFLNYRDLIFHAKNQEAAELLDIEEAFWFTHDKDDFAIVNNLMWGPSPSIWGLSEKIKPSSVFSTIIVSNNIDREQALQYNGICTDFPFKYR